MTLLGMGWLLRSGSCCFTWLTRSGDSTEVAGVVSTRVQVWGEFCQAGTGFHINTADEVLGV